MNDSFTLNLPPRGKHLTVLLSMFAALCNVLYAQNSVANRIVSTAQLCNSTTTYVMYLPPTYGSTLSSYYTVMGGSLVEYDNGTAVLTGTAVNTANSNARWAINVTFGGRTYTTPSGSPKAHSCLAYSTTDWYYYTTTTGTLVGQLSLLGKTMNITRNGPSFQVGTGANVQDGLFGASGWFNYTTTGTCSYYSSNFASSGSGDFNFRLSGSKLPSTCSNVTSAGSIGSDESLCGSYDPANINSLTLPAGGGTGALEYVWLQTTDPNTANGTAFNYTVIAGATTNTYNPPVVSQTTWFRRCARRQGCVNYVGESNWVRKEVINNCNTTISTCAANFYDTGGSVCPYSDNQNYTTTYCANNGGQIKFTFSSFNVENGYDFLYVYNGSSTASPLIGTYTGTTLPPAITSSNGCLTIKFTSDANVTAAGWAATISCTSATTCSNVTSAGSIGSGESICGAYNPALINSIALPTGGTGTLEYVWLQTTNAAVAAGTATTPVPTTIAGATGATYDPGTISVTTWYRRCARRSGCTQYVGESNWVKKEVKTTPILTPWINVNNAGWTNGTSATLCSGGSISLGPNTLTQTGITGSWSWTGPNGFTYTTANSSQSTPVISNIQPTQAGTYTAVFTPASTCVNSYGCTATISFTVTVNTCTSCQNVTSAGSIGSDESICGTSFDPALINSIALPSGGTGTLEYVWLQTTDPNTAAGTASTYSQIIGATSSTYDPGVVSVTTWFRRCAKRSGCTAYVGESNWVKKAVNVVPVLTPWLAINGGTAIGTSTATLCKGGALTFCPAAQTGVVGNWSWTGPGGFTFTTTNNNQSIVPFTNIQTAQAGVYTAVFTGTNGCTATISMTINVNSVTATATSNAPCLGGAISLTATGGGTYSWSGPNGFTSASATPSIANATALMGGTYTVTVTGTNGCTGTASVAVVVNTCCQNVTSAGSIGSDESICGTSFDPALINSIALPTGGTGTLEYVWLQTTNAAVAAGTATTPVPTTIAGATGATYDPGVISVTTWYRRCARRSGCTQYVGESNWVKKEVKTAPILTPWISVNGAAPTSVSSATLCKGGAVTLCPAAQTGVTGNWSWTGPGGFTFTTTNNNQSVVPFTNIQVTQAGVYTATFTATNGCTATISLTVNVNSVTATATGNSPCLGAAISLTATGGGTYSWSGPNGFISTLAAPSIANATAAMGGTYTVTVTGTNGCTGTASVAVVVNTCCQNVTTAGSIGSDESICGTSFDPALINSIALPTGGTGTLEYVWLMTTDPTTAAGTTFNYTQIAGATGATYDPSVISVTTWYRRCARRSGCTQYVGESNWVKKEVKTAPILTPWISVNGAAPTSVSSATLCKGGAVTLCPAAQTGVTGNWSWTGPGGFTFTTTNNNQSVVPFTNIQVTQSGVYTATFTATNGCTATISLTINVNTVTPTAISNSPVCAGGTISLTATGGGTYSWSGPNGFTSASATPSIANATTAMGGTYTVTVTGANGCTGTASTTVVVNSVATATASNNGPVCAGQTVQLSTTATGTYSWSGPNGFTSALQNPIINSAGTVNAGTYTVYVTSGTCQSSGTTTVVVTPLPSAVIQCSGPVCQNVTTPISALNAGAGATYSWNFGATATPSTGVGVGPFNVAFANAGSNVVTLTVTQNGCSNTSSLSITVNTNPVVTVTPANNSTVCLGATLNLTATGGGTYSWSGPNGFTSTLANPSISNITAAAAGTYSVTVTGANGCTSSASTTINLNCGSIGDFVWNDTNGNGVQDPTELGVQGVTVTLYNSANVAIATQTTGTNGSYLFPNLAAGTYTVAFTNLPTNFVFSPALQGGNPALDSDPNTTTGITAPIVLALGQNITTIDAGINACSPANINGNNVICQGGSTVFSANTGVALAYQWYFNGNLIAGATSSTYTASQAGAYYVVVTRGGCATTSNTLTLTVNPNPTATASSNSPVCTATPLNLTATGGGTYAWAGPNGFTSTQQNPSFANANNSMMGTYSVTVTNANGCTASATTSVTVFGNVTNPGQINNAQSNCGPFDPAPITNVTSPTPSTGLEFVWLITTDPATAAGTAFNYTQIAGANGLTYDPTTISQTTWYRRCARVAGCTQYVGESNWVKMEVFPTPSVTATGNNVACNGGTTTITATAADGTPAYQYSLNGGAYQTSNTFTVGMGTYTITVKDANNCTASTSVTISQPNTLAATSNATAILCNGGNSTVTVTATGGTAPYNGTGTFTVTAGTYTYTVTDANGCSTTTSVTVIEPTVLAATSNATSILCNGGNSTVTVTATGGTAPYTGTGSFTVTAGTYTYTVTDANGCATTTSVTVIEPTALAAASNATAILCNGGNSTVTVTATGGTAPYNGTGTFTVTSGTYTYTVTDANGCSTTTSVTVIEPMALGASIAPVAAVCTGQATASVNLTVNGGTSAYTYSWSNGATTEDLTNVGAGTYDVVVTDANGCTTSATITVGSTCCNVTNPGSIGYDESNCGSFDPAAIVSIALPSGGFGTLEYVWLETTDPATAAGTAFNYTQIPGANGPTYDPGTISQTTWYRRCSRRNGCTQYVGESNWVKKQVNPVPSVTAAGNNVACNGGTTTITATAADGTPAYEYSLNGGTYQVSNTFTVGMGTYSITVKDANNCTASTSVTISQPTVLAATSNATSILCNGGNSTVTVTATGGTAPYNGTGTFTVTAGTYTYTVTDANGCSTTTSVTVGEPTALAAASNATAILCNGGNSTVTVTATGGTAPYTGTGTFTVTAGTYTYTVTDANGCSTTTSVTITEPTVLAAASNATAILCNGGNSTVTVTAIGGTAPYNGTGTFTVTAGTYTYTVTDANGCSTTTSVTVIEPTVLGASIAPVAAVCTGQATASVNLTVSGGTSAYTYSWSNGATTEDLTNVGAGTYDVVVTDANGCTTSATITVGSTCCNVTNPGSIGYDESNCGSFDPAAIVSIALPSGGFGTLEYVWLETTDPATAAGTAFNYTQIPGANGPTYDPGTISQTTWYRRCSRRNGCTQYVGESNWVKKQVNPVPSVTAAGNNVACNGGTTTITATGADGTPAYEYSLNGGTYQTSNTFTVGMGTYSITVTDANNCTASTSVTISQPTVLAASSNATSILCNGGNSTVTVTATGGTTPYNGTGTFTVTAGNYTYTVTDANGCSTTTSVTVIEPTALAATSNATSILCNGGNSTVTVTATGATAPYNGTGTFTVTAGTYNYTVTDANGCSTTTSVTVIEPTVLAATSNATAILCNGGNSTVTVTATGGTTPYTGTGTFTVTAGTYTYTVTDANGCSTTTSVTVGEPTALAATSNATAILCNGGNSTVTVTATGGTAPYQGTGTFTVIAGTYTYTVTDANGCSTTTSVTVGEPTALAAASNATAILCNGGNSTVTVTATGGTAPYTGTGTFTVTAGTYTYTVTDANGCSTTTSVTITEPTALAAASNATAILCNGGNSTVTVTATGGTAPYNGTGTFTVTAGTYTYTVTDANGCSTTTSVTISEPSVLSASSSATSILCNGGNSTVTVTATGGTAPYTGTGTFTVTAGTYTYTVTDANGCSTTTSVTITEPSVLSAASSATSILCNGGNSTVTVTATGGTAPYTGTGTFTETAGTYTYTVTDANGCSTTTSVTVGEPTVLAATSNATTILCNGGNSTVTVTATGGTAPYNGTGTFTVTAGTYTYTVTDANGCTSTTSVTVGEPTVLAATSNATAILCNGGNSTVMVTAIGGTAPYNGTGTFTVTAGTYTYTVTDANGCLTTTSVTVGEPTALAAASNATAILCNGGNSTVTVTATGGTAPYTGTGSFTVTAGTYTYTVTDANGCSTTTSVTVIEPTVLAATSNATSILCNGGNSTVTVTATGGTAPYTGTGTFTVTAGTYTYTVTDANGCSTTTSVTVGEPTALAAASNATAILCNGGNSTVTVTATGGTAPYTGTGTFTVTAGTYTYTVTDANGCSTTTSVIVGQPTTLGASIAPVAAVCTGQATASVNLTVNGGTSPYTYLWSNGATTEDLTNVGAGTYDVVVTDANGCTTSATITVGSTCCNVTNPGSIGYDESNCGSFDPAAIVSIALPSGGFGTLEYVWLETTDPATAAGTAFNYTQIPGANGPTYDPGTISQTTWYRRCSRRNGCTQFVGESNWVKKQVNPVPSVTAAGNNVACNGGTTIITATATSGTPTYEYSLNGGAYQTSNTFTVGMGTYSITVKDANNCTASTSVTISQPTVLTATSNATSILCNGGNSTVTVTATGGTAPYNGTGTFTVTAGTYTYTVTDANGCSTTTSVTISEPSVLSASSSATSILCNGGNSTVTVTATGGTAPYTGTGTFTVTAGTYTYTVTDANGCSTTTSVIVGQPTVLAATSNATAILCNGGNSTVTVTATGGTAPYTGTGTFTVTAGTYTYTVTDANGCATTTSVTVIEPTALAATSNATVILCNGGNSTVTVTATGGTAPYNGTGTFTVTAGNYTYTVTDANGCSTTTSVTVGQPTALAAASSASAILCNGGNSTVTVTATGGTAPYNGTGTFTVTAGTYTYTVTDANGCSTTTTVTVGEPAVLAIAPDMVQNATCNGSCNGGVWLTAIGGVTPYTYTINGSAPASSNQPSANQIDIYSLCAGSYTIVVTDANGCTASTTINVTEPTVLSASSSATTILCNGGNSTVTVTATGGTAPYTGTGTFTVTAGTYTYTVTDANGCSTTTSVTVGEPTALAANSNATAILCNGGNSTVTVTATGGTAPYTGTGSFTVTAGTYTYTVTDANGCSTTTSVTVGQPTALAATTTKVDVTCTGGTNGSIDLTAAGGTPTYTYSWYDGATTEDRSNLSAGTYTVKVTDLNGCTAITSAIIGTQYSLPTAQMTLSDDSICVGKFVIANAVNAGAGATYVWNFGANAVAPTTAGAGPILVHYTTNGDKVITLTVTSVEGCVNTVSDTVRAVNCASIGDYVWNDTDKDGTQDGNEVGVSGVTVTLYNSANQPVATTTTDAYGNYNFESVFPGNYTVGFTLPVDYVFTSQDATNDNQDSDPNPTTGRTNTVTVVEGVDITNVDAGVYYVAPTVASLGNFVWNDANGNGAQDAGEEGVSDVTVTLYDAANNPVGTTITNANGFYQFTNLTPATYSVGFSLPIGYKFTVQDNTIESKDSDVDTLTGRTALVTLVAGQNNPDVDAGIIRTSTATASVGDYVFNDLNQNGIQDAGENGIGNVTVNLYDINNVVVGTTTTDAFGYYIFTNLIPGGYAVEFIAPAGYVFSPKEAGVDRAKDSDADATSGKSDFFVVIADERKTTVDAGLYLSTPAGTARLGDYVWYDTNNNGVQDGNESGAAGVTAQLFDANTNTLLNTTATNAVGYYSFTNLAAGNYYVVFSNLPQGYQFTTQTTGTANGSDANVANGSTPTVTLAAGQNNPDIDAGIITAPQAPGKASLGDFVWNDLNNNGVQDAGELGVGGVTVTLYAANGTTVLKTTTTVANGYYIFNNLDAGDYVVGFSNLPSGYAFSPANQGGNDNTDSDANTGTGKTSVITLGEGDAVLNVDAGIYNPAATGTIGDFVWNDANGNGVQDPTEVGVAGVTVTLYDATTGNPVTSTVTDANGNYTFTGVPAGTYAVGFSNLPTGFTFTTPNQGGNPNSDSDADATTGISAPFTLTSGQTKNDVDAGLQTTRAAIGNYVWFDNNQNGAQDANEAGVAGVTVTLYNSANNAVGSTVTDANGFYYFPNVIPANGYTIGFSTLPANVVFTAKDATADANDSDVNPATGRTDAFNVAAGEVNYTFDAGIYAPSLASWEGYVWLDVNKNGQQNAGEEPVAGVTVTLYNSANQPVGVTVTDASGAYHFDNLTPSSYYVGFSSLPQNTSLTTQNVGPDATDSDADQTTGNTSPVALAAGQHVKNEDAGIIPPVGSLGNYVWIDANGNGLQDEPASNGINGLTIQLWNPGANAVAGGGDDVLITSTVTANDGSGNPGYYQFFGLLSGKYFVKFPTSNGSGGLTTAVLTAGTDGNSDANTFTGNSPVVTINGFASGLAKDNPTIDAGYVIGQILCPSACFKQDTLLQTVSLPRQKLGIANKVLNINKFNPALGSLAKVEIQARIVIDNKYKVENDDALPAQITLNTNGNGNFKGLGLPTTGINASYNESRDLGILAEGDVFTFAGPDYVEDSLILGDFYSSPVNAALNGFVGTGTIPYTVNANGSFSVNGPSNYFAQVSTYARVELYVRYIYCTSQCAKVGDYVWNDENKDGIQDASEVGIAGATVALYNNVGTLVSTTATDAYGKYTFNDVIPGQYSVGFTAPVGYVLTTQDATTEALDSDPDQTTSKTGVFSVAILDNVTNIDAGYYATAPSVASLGDFVWNDLNNNGMQEAGEPGVANVNVTLYQAGNPINTTTTDITGKYIFNNVVSGTYEIGFANLPAGYSFVAKDATEDSKDSDVNTGTGKTDLITVTYGANMTVDAGIYNPNVINRLGDRVWNDANANGIQDGTEMGVGGVTVTLYNSFNLPVNHALTDGNGNYLFAGVPAGTYTLGINNLPSGFVISPKDATADANDSDANLDGRTDAFTITSTQVKLDVDFGINEPKATLGNFVWFDANTNGIQDATEAGVAGVTVTLYNSSNVAQAIAITNGAGEYCFKNLNAGTYTLGMTTLPLGKGIATKDAGANTQDAVDNDFDYTTGRTDAFTLVAGQVNGTLDGGLVQLGAITGKTWHDEDKKGDQTADEPAIPNVLVKLFNGSNVQLDAQYTDANGHYSFNGLYPGSYYVVFDTVTDRAFTFANQVDDAFDSDVNVNNGHAPSSNGINDDYVAIAGQIAVIDAGYRNTNLFLPIELLSFTGELVNGVDGLLEWTTSRELNSHHFELYRSLDKVSFERVGTDVPAHGNSYTNIDYSSTDKRIDKLKVNVVYYRLKMIDIDGTFKWSDNIVELNLEDNAPISASLYPNPITSGNLTVEYHLKGIKYADATITNALGQAIYNNTITDNGKLLEIDVTNWSKGVYFLKLATETDNVTFKVIVE